jgi:hypothetical protein
MSASPSKFVLTGLRRELHILLEEGQKLPFGSDLPKKAAAARGLVFDPPLAVVPSGSTPNDDRFSRSCYYTKVTLVGKIDTLIRYTLGLKLETWLSETHAKEMREYIKAHKDRVAEISATKGVAPHQADELGTITVRLVSNLKRVIEHLWPLAM